MSESTSCKVCGQATIHNVPNDSTAHVGGGELMQRCESCGWKGSQFGRFSQCPQCGNGTALVDDHYAKN